VARELDGDELIGNWTLVGDELDQLSGRRGATKLGFALLLRFYAVHGRFPSGRSEIPDQAVAYVARLVDVPASDLGFYEWDGRTIKAHRTDIRRPGAPPAPSLRRDPSGRPEGPAAADHGQDRHKSPRCQSFQESSCSLPTPQASRAFLYKAVVASDPPAPDWPRPGKG